MLNFCLKYILAFLLFIPVFVLAATPVYAANTITSAILNGSTSVTVAPSASITAVVNMTTISAWQSTAWTVNAVSTCVNHADHNGSGSFSETFTITAPASVGTYNVDFIAHGNQTCTNSIATLTLTRGIIVATATPTPTPTSTPTPTPTPTTTTAPGQLTSTPVPTSSPSSSSSSSSSTPSVTYYPSVALAPYSPNPTNKTSLTFSGTAAIDQGTIQAVEYTITNGDVWIPAQPRDGNFNGKDENFTFSISNLAEGKYTIKARAKSGAGVLTQEGSYASATVTIVTTPPLVTLDKITPNPTKNQTPTLTGTTSAKLVDITKVEISIDNGKSWQVAKRSGSKFSIALTKLEDGNYPVRARAFDSAGNIGQSETQTLIIDTIPPIIGGGMLSLGPQILTPNKNGTVSIVAGTETTMAISMKGGVTEAEIKTDSDSFKLFLKMGTNIWVGKMKFDSGGEKPLTISAVDGAGNHTERNFNTLTVENSGIVEDKKTKQAIENAEVSVYFFENISKQWILWEGNSYGQRNPQKTDGKGSYSFMVPAGKYYMEVTAPGYHTTQSEILTLSETSILNFTIPLRSKPKLTFSLPFIGDVTLTIPTLSPPDTIQTTVTSSQVVPNKNTLPTPSSSAPQFTLPNLENKDIKLSDSKGKKMVLIFLAPWSSLSIEQASILSQINKDLPKNSTILGVSLQESTATTQTFMQRGNYSFPIVADRDGKTATDYNITILPHHVFIDANGKIQDTYTGVLSKEELMKKLSNVP